MSDIPIIFSGTMVRALLDGRKTMTRRIPTTQWRKPAAGDRLWVRESIRLISVGPSKQVGIAYAADGDMPDVHFFSPASHKMKLTGATPSIHMPRWASRLALTVTATKIERLQGISWNDAIAEGLTRGDPMPEVPNSPGTIWHDGVSDPLNDWTRDPTAAFATLWKAIHGPESWAANPEVVALTFTVHKVNIDRMARSRTPGSGEVG